MVRFLMTCLPPAMRFVAVTFSPAILNNAAGPRVAAEHHRQQADGHTRVVRRSGHAVARTEAAAAAASPSGGAPGAVRRGAASRSRQRDREPELDPPALGSGTQHRASQRWAARRTRQLWDRGGAGGGEHTPAAKRRRRLTNAALPQRPGGRQRGFCWGSPGAKGNEQVVVPLLAC